ncbi:hypothetical protein ACFQ4C_03220 [Larkinella insperata]|uniref:Uncharacterized protein n=1 Tax=Larkinella insperata TaxID=332158 RepID=A0ABW3Q3H5_9BACT|nr:hypothetical protein [Larkinella insperata]
MGKKVRLSLIGSLILGLATTTQAQQTIFNVPSSDITKEGKVLAQEQLEIQDMIRSTTTVSYGLSKDWEVGLNLYNLDFTRQNTRFFRNDTTTSMPYAPLLLVNAQKAFQLSEIFKIGIGGQGGLNLSSGRSQAVYYAYANLAASLVQEHYKLALGGYNGNARFLGDGPHSGIQAGVDAGLWYHKVHLLADWLSGSHQLGQLSVGVEVFLGEHLPLAVGWQRSNQDGSQGFVLQLTYTPQ